MHLCVQKPVKRGEDSGRCPCASPQAVDRPGIDPLRGWGGGGGGG